MTVKARTPARIKVIWPYGRETCEKAAAWCKARKLSWNNLTTDEKRMCVSTMETEDINKQPHE